MKTVLIFGGSGFIGQHIARRMAKNGYKVIIPYQGHVDDAKLRFIGGVGQICPIKFRSLSEKIIDPYLAIDYKNNLLYYAVRVSDYK